MYHDRAAWHCAFFVGKKKWKQRISTKKCCPCTVSIACHVRQSIIGCRSSRKGGQVSKTNIEPVGQWDCHAGNIAARWRHHPSRKEGHRRRFFPLVWPFKTSSLGERFPDDDAVERAVRAWFRQQPKEFYAAGFQGLVKRWDKCLNLYGDYVEK